MKAHMTNVAFSDYSMWDHIGFPTRKTFVKPINKTQYSFFKPIMEEQANQNDEDNELDEETIHKVKRRLVTS